MPFHYNQTIFFVYTISLVVVVPIFLFGGGLGDRVSYCFTTTIDCLLPMHIPLKLSRHRMQYVAVGKYVKGCGDCTGFVLLKKLK